MSVLITGIEMPKDKAALLIICPSGKVYYEYLEVAGNAVPVPPHGRLIDADELEDILYNSPECITVFDAIRKVKSAPTIIPAEEGGEEK